MKKKLLIIIPVAVVVFAIAAVALYLLFSGYEFDSGRIVVCGENTYVFVDEDGNFWEMNDVSAGKSLFDGLETGDEILVYRSSQMALSYPGQCGVKLCFKRGDGTVADVHIDAIKALEIIGWIDGEEAEELPEEEKEDTLRVLADLVNSLSELPFGLLEAKSEEELMDMCTEAGYGFYVVNTSESYNFDFENGSIHEEYDWEFMLDGFENDEGAFGIVTRIVTNNPYTKICGVTARDGISKVLEEYEKNGFTVKTGEGEDEQRVKAILDELSIEYIFFGKDSVRIEILLELPEGYQPNK